MDRLSPSDATELATDVGPAPRHVGAVLMLTHDDPEALAELVARRLATVARFRQRLVRPAPGLGRPYWAPTAATAADPERPQVEVHRVAMADDEALLAVAAEEMGKRLATDRPPWRAVVLAHEGRAVGLVLVMHHVLADGIGGLAVLVSLADGAPSTIPGPAPSVSTSVTTGEPVAGPAAHADTSPTTWDLLADIWAERRGALRRLPATLRTLKAGRAELGGGPRAPRCSLNAPTGALRGMQLAEVDLEAARAAAHAGAATINDLLLVAVVAALGQALGRRGEHPDALVVSVPISARRTTTGADLGNDVGVMPIRVPLTGTLEARLAEVAAQTRERKARTSSIRGSSAALLGPWFRTLARVGVFGWFVNRQRLVTTFLANLPGPPPVAVGGAEVRRIVPVGVIAGKVAVAFAALSYAGRLVVTVVTDPAVVPEGTLVAGALDQALRDLTTGASREH